MVPRYYPRVQVKAFASFTGSGVTCGGITCEGTVLDVTVPGCLIQSSSVSARKGDSLTLRVTIPQVRATFLVARAVVRWVDELRFGVEFVEMDPKERVRYNATVNRLLQQQAPSSTQQQYCEDWHFADYAA